MKTKTKSKCNCFQNHEENQNKQYFVPLHI